MSIKPENNRAFKEWAVACNAMSEGRQMLLIRKGGIREEGGSFTVNDSEFFLMPTYEHQNPSLLQEEYAEDLVRLPGSVANPNEIIISSYAVVDAILTGENEEQVNSVLHETIWNEAYVKQRFDFNPYDPLYLLIMKVYRLSEPIAIPLIPEYIGCRSWVTLDRQISTRGAVPAISDEEFEKRKDEIIFQLARKIIVKSDWA